MYPSFHAKLISIKPLAVSKCEGGCMVPRSETQLMGGGHAHTKSGPEQSQDVKSGSCNNRLCILGRRCRSVDRISASSTFGKTTFAVSGTSRSRLIKRQNPGLPCVVAISPHAGSCLRDHSSSYGRELCSVYAASCHYPSCPHRMSSKRSLASGVIDRAKSRVSDYTGTKPIGQSVLGSRSPIVA